jgi:hypothetical protein
MVELFNSKKDKNLKIIRGKKIHIEPHYFFLIKKYNCVFLNLY